MVVVGCIVVPGRAFAPGRTTLIGCFSLLAVPEEVFGCPGRVVELGRLME